MCVAPTQLLSAKHRPQQSSFELDANNAASLHFNPSPDANEHLSLELCGGGGNGDGDGDGDGDGAGDGRPQPVSFACEYCNEARKAFSWPIIVL